jgi:protocatechuate 3,4-dioxygenase alpha subunit
VKTPSQTVGPYYAIGCCRSDESVLAPDGVRLHGTLFDGDGAPIADGMIELWDDKGRRWGRSGTHPDGDFSFLVPRDVPYLHCFVFARGLLRHQLTLVHFGEPDLPGLSDEERSTLVAVDEGDAFRFDIRMQGDRATVFFEH